MSYPVTIPPYGQGSEFGAIPSGSGSAFEYGGYHYAFMYESALSSAYTGNLNIRALRSSDFGATWAELDAANAPHEAIIDQSYNTVARDGSKVWLLQAIQNPSLGFRIHSFDLTAGTWSTATDVTSPHPVASISLQYSFKLIVRGANDYILLLNYTKENVGGTNYGRVYYCTWDGATFGAPVVLPGQSGIAANICLDSACVDSTGRILITYFQNSGFPSNVYTVTLSPSNVFGTPATMAHGALFTSYCCSSAPITYTVGGVETFAFALGAFDSGPGEEILVCYAPVADNPTWAFSTVEASNSVDIWTQNDGGFLTPRPFALEEANGTLVLVWTYDTNSGSNPVIGHYRISTAPAATLVWSASANLWDTPVFSDGGTHHDAYASACQLLAFRTLTGVAIIGVAGVSAGQTGGSYFSSSETAEYYFYPVGVSLTIDCGNPPSGTLMIPYDHTFPVTGGATPYGFAITGLPTGLTLDAATGEVSGTPTEGGMFTLHVTVTDSLGASASVDCTVKIRRFGNVAA